MDYEAVIGLETHVQLKTKSKMCRGCANAFGAEPNTNVCPVCFGLTGVLPVPNEEALRLTVLTGYLLHCEIPRFAKFDRKSYFHPDMPKNYQITQYDKPSTANGWVEFEFGDGTARVRIARAHLEEDVGKSAHFERNSGVDFNRAGGPDGRGHDLDGVGCQFAVGVHTSVCNAGAFQSVLRVAKTLSKIL